MRRVLIANRGAISVRIQRTLAAMGIPAAVVFSEADRAAPHVLSAERSVCIGPPSARESYLNMDALLNAARELHCDAVHPGYGFLSENAEFAARCRAAGLTFIGPPTEAVRSMGDKARARQLAQQVGVSCVPGGDGATLDAELNSAAQRIGFPLLIKSAHGGGGKGMRVVEQAPAFMEALQAARRESLAAFGRDEVLLERLVREARHVEVQVLCDAHGRAHAFPERECSLQRRHQKVLEESPSSVVHPDLRRRLQDAALKIARAAAYESVGTVEFLLEPDGQFWFLEMNTRLQVEHGITELVTGVDLVEWQIRVAQGEHLPTQLPADPQGHAFEVRVYAEDPARGFLPATGRLEHVAWPFGPGIRVDAGVASGSEITPWYDPMLGKVMAHGFERESARRRLVEALARTALRGTVTNARWLRDLLDSPMVRAGNTYTTSLNSYAGPPEPKPPEDAAFLAAAVLGVMADAPQTGTVQSTTRSEGLSLGAWRLQGGVA
jgi:acetyl/propionyl-CoA carboxylase alpha subunit